MTNKFFKTLGYGYILLPVIFFFLGWLKLWIAIPLCIILLIIFLESSIMSKVNCYLPPNYVYTTCCLQLL